MKDSDQRQIEETVIQALARVDEQVLVSNFADDWSVAQVNNKPLHVWWPGFKISPVYTAGIVTAIIAVVVWMALPRTETNEQVIVSDTITLPERTKNIEAGYMWTAPTDELLRIDSLIYENQFITFVTYDPVTMEIR